MDGIILINKEKGYSSNNVINKVKHILSAEKAGHLGTLDVLGEGLLPVTLGKGTKLFEYFLKKDKVYKTIFKFGCTTATLDMEGEIVEKNDKIVTREELEKIIPHFIGKQEQMPPIYSAKKVHGEKAYDLARKGKQVELKPKEIEIYSIKILNEISENEFEFEVWCSSGTYIRSLCRDMANHLNTYGVMSYIQRTKCGKFDIKDAVTIGELANGKINIIKLEDVLDFPKLKVDAETEKKLLSGVHVYYEGTDGNYNLFGGKYLGIAIIKSNNLFIETRLI